MSLNVSAISSYVEEKKNGLIRNAVIGAQSVKLFNLQTGIKGATALNLLNTAVSFGDGSSCGWNEAGTSTLSQRILTPGYPKVNMSFCDKALLKTYANYEVKVAAGQKTLPFEEDFVNGVIEGVGAALEKGVWQGDTATSNTDANLNKFDGFVKIIEAAEIATALTFASSTSMSTRLGAIYAAIPSKCFGKGEVVAYMGSDNYRAYIQELIAAGKLIITTNLNDVPMPDNILIPGTNVRVYGVAGLDGTNKIFASYKDNFVYGTDLTGDEERFEFWFSQDNREFRLDIEFAAGVQVAFPDLIVEGKIA